MEVYKLQNVAIHKARAELEGAGVLNPWSGLEQVRDMAAELNSGVRSISSLNIAQRRALIERLIGMGAKVRNPVIYESDLRAEAARSGKKRKVLTFVAGGEKQLRMMDALATRVNWRNPDGFTRLCEKVIKAPRPTRRKQVTAICAALRSMIKKQAASESAQAEQTA
jgi:hypothetical protein